MGPPVTIKGESLSINHKIYSGFCRKEGMGILKFCSVLVFTFTAFFVEAKMTAEEKGRKIAEYCDKAARGFKGEVSVMQMDIISAHGEKVSRGMTLKKKEMDTTGERSLLIVESPSDVKGTKLLTWGHKDKSDEQWLYLPAIKRVKRISAQLKSGSFMGSEFAYEDFSSKEVNKYNYKFIKDDEIKGRKAWVVEQTPKESESGYSKEVVWYDKQYRAPIKTEFYDRKGELFKIAELTGYNLHLRRWWRPEQIKMSNVQTRNSSIMNWQERQLKVDLSDDSFRSENLKE